MNRPLSGPRAIGAEQALAIVEEAVRGVPREALPEILAALARVNGIATLRLVTPEREAQEDVLISVAEAAALLGLSRSTLYKNLQVEPIASLVKRTTKGRPQFSRAAIRDYIAEGRRRGAA